MIIILANMVFILTERCEASATFETNPRSTDVKNKQLKRALHLAENPDGQRKRVNFGGQEVFYRRANQMGVCPSTCWYDGNESATFKEDFTAGGKRMARACKGPASNGQILKDVFEKCVANENIDDAMLHETCRFLQEPENVGLEKFASRKLFSDRWLRRDRMNKVVKKLQASGSYPSQYHQEQTAQIISEECRKISRPSTLMAGLLAKAASASL
jgi:hypothetical protein